MPPTWLWGYLLPLGFLFLIWGGLPPEKARRITPLAALAIALTILSYWAVGYAFHLGGAGVVNPGDPNLAGLRTISTFIGDSNAWGMIGSSGFGLSGEAITPTALGLFLAYLPIIATGVLVIALAVGSAERRGLLLTLGLLSGALILPIAACWIWGGGWLANLGRPDTLELGHGFVDFGGSALILWLPGCLTLGLLLFQERLPAAPLTAPPPAHYPLLAHAGALLLGLGWTGWALSAPLHTYGAALDWNRAAVNILLGMGGSVITSQFYAWLVTGDLEPLLAARGLAAGWGALLAGAPFLPGWAAIMIGLLAGLLFPLILYTIETGLRLRDSAATIALGLVGGGLGLLSIALFADGHWGQGWNAIAPLTGTSEAVVGIRGLFPGSGLSPDTGQLIAQLIGMLALGLWGLAWGALLGFLTQPGLFQRLALAATPRPEPAPAPAPELTSESAPQE